MASFTQHRFLTLSSPDANGSRPKVEMTGKSYFHPKTKRIYKVSGFMWDSSADEWVVRYHRNGCNVEFTRKLAEFAEPRFVEIAEDSKPDWDVD